MRAPPNSIHEGSDFTDLITSQRPAPSNTITLGIRFQRVNLKGWGGHFQDIAVRIAAFGDLIYVHLHDFIHLKQTF